MEMRSHLDIKVAIRVSQPKSSPLEIFGKSIFEICHPSVPTTCKPPHLFSMQSGAVSGLV